MPRKTDEEHAKDMTLDELKVRKFTKELIDLVEKHELTVFDNAFVNRSGPHISEEAGDWYSVYVPFTVISDCITERQEFSLKLKVIRELIKEKREIGESIIRELSRDSNALLKHLGTSREKTEKDEEGDDDETYSDLDEI